MTSTRKKQSLSDMRKARPIVKDRSRGVCEVRIPGVCEGRGTNMHHRQRDGVGPSLPFNLIHLCGQGNYSGCHGWISTHHDEAVLKGWIVPTWDDPAEVPWAPA